MLSLFWIVLWAVLTGLMVATAVRLHARHKELVASPLPRLDDAAIDTILATGELSVDEDEPLDLIEIDESEERFWSESWDEPDEW
ncbi:MAG: hypothetical protein OEO79_07515 [Gemmatimonadota bacterium]|nr:hypothetical protein [Gemmatimonadota bacterium]MDH3422306.1 hypothetical protein [Gemmatimonadota bacterium]